MSRSIGCPFIAKYLILSMTVQVKSLHANNYNKDHTEFQITVHQPTILNEVGYSKTLIMAQTI